MDNLLLEAQNRIKNKRMHFVNQTGKKKEGEPFSKYISELFTRTLLSVILVLLCAIFVNSSDANLLIFKNKLFNETLAFTKINSLYAKYFGDIIPEKVTNSIPVFENTPDTSTIEQEGNSYFVSLNSNTYSFLESGVVVFLGEKEGFGKTMIVQGIDGVDIWYSNLENYNVSMYDYVEKGNIVGEFHEQKALLTFMENGEYIGYEKYIQ